MKEVQVTLGGALVRLRPESVSGNRFAMKVEAPGTLLQCLQQLGTSDDTRLLVILNGQVIQSQDYAKTDLSESDELSLMPPIQAG